MSVALTPATPNVESHRPASAWRRWAVRLAPFVITGSVVVAILYKYPVSAIRRYLTEGDLLPAIPISFVGVLVTLLLISMADRLVVRGAFGHVRYWSVLKAKAGSSLLDVFGYVAGHSAYAVWIGRFLRTRPSLAGGAMLYIAAADLLAVCFVASVSMFFVSDANLDSLRIVAASVAGLMALFLVLGPYQLFGKWPVFEPWARIPRRIGFVQVGFRIVATTVWVVATWLAAWAFGMYIPLSAMLTYFPIVMLVAALPVNVAGFGAVQGAWLLLTDYASGSQILAFQLVWTLLVSCGIVVRGLPFVRGFVREIDRSEKRT